VAELRRSAKIEWKATEFKPKETSQANTSAGGKVN
jgi:hypothetical protein